MEILFFSLVFIDNHIVNMIMKKSLILTSKEYYHDFYI